MLAIFISGACGFLIFDAYRVAKSRDLIGRPMYTVFSGHFLVVHIFCYFAAGVLGVFTNLDVALRPLDPAHSALAIHYENAGAYMRAFALGLAGPAGLSKGNETLASRFRPHAGNGEDAEPDTQLNSLTQTPPKLSARLLSSIRILLMR